jgi:hypothetical protein
MLKSLLIITLFLNLLPHNDCPIIRRVIATTPYDASIVFEYANEYIPEGTPLNNKKIEEFISQLKKTGLFIDIKTNLIPTDDPQEIDIEVIPTWNSQRDSFAIDDVVFDGFKDIDVMMMRKFLDNKGVGRNSKLLKYSVLRIKEFMYEAVETGYKDDIKKMHKFEEQILNSSIRVEQVNETRFRLVIRSDPQ